MFKFGKLAKAVWRDARTTLDTVRSRGALARKDSGKSVASQLAEIVALRCGPGHLEADEYYQYRLYDDKRFTWAQKKEFLGRFMENRLVPVLHEGWWLGLANDKIATYAFLGWLGLPIPETYAAYHEFRELGRIPVLHTPDALARYMRTQLPTPCIVKPIFGMWGRDVHAIRRYDAHNDRLVLENGTELEVEGLVKTFRFNASDGALFQEFLKPHPAIAELCGPRICSVRVVTLMDASGPRLLSTLWKVATGSSMADNYWEPGNLVAPIDPSNGRVGQTITGLGRDIRNVDAHPDTGRKLPGAVLPDWGDTVALCLRASAALPGIPMQAWDVALTDRGPVLLEVNVNGGMRLPQLVIDAGLYRGEFRRFLERYGYPKKRSLAGLLAD
jgi:hypothetical protein